MSTRKHNHATAWRDRLLPTATAHQARLQIYQPTWAPRNIERTIETPYGSGTIKGRLGMQHALLMEALQYCALLTRPLDNGGLAILIDPHDLRKEMAGREGSRYGWETIMALTGDLRSSVIRGTYSGWPIMDGILDRLVPSDAYKRLHPVTGEQRPMYLAEITPTYRAWLECDPLPLHYQPSPLARLHHAISAATARWILTQRDEPRGGWKLDTVISAVGDVPTRKRRWQLWDDRADLETAGVLIDDKRRIHLPPRSAHDRGCSVYDRPSRRFLGDSI